MIGPLLLVSAILGGCTSQAEASSAMKRLYEDLFTDYNRLILPVASNKTKVTVTVGLKLGQILDLNLKQQILSTNVWVEQTWHDYKLEWQPELYEGIDMIHVPAENIWIPDIVLFNNADGNYELTLVAKARLYSNGTVVWKPPTMFRSTCEIDVEYFPFDIQTCFLRFGSWTYAGDEVELQHVGKQRKVEIGIDLSQFYKNVEWDIIDVPAYYNENYYECCTEPFPDITFKIVIRRKMLFYLVNLILPVALMTFMTVSVFYLPSDSNEKVTLSISILTSLIVFFLLMLEIIPASSLAVPLFGKYLLFTLVLISLSACVSVYVLNIHHRSPSVHSMSPMVRKLFLQTLPRLLRLNRPDPRERSSLNRFRKKKIAQQLLNAPQSSNKVYDLAQPFAASLNLIETLHKSYELSGRADKMDDTPAKGEVDKEAEKEEEEGRYFRRYVDDYIGQLNKIRGRASTAEECRCSEASRRSARACCEHSKCCSRANQPLDRAHHSQGSQCQRLAASCCGGGANRDYTESSAEMRCPLVSAGGKLMSLDESSRCNNCGHTCTSVSRGCTGRHSSQHIGMLNDDTLDMTFDYDDQDNNHNNNNIAANMNGSRSNVADLMAAGRTLSQQDDLVLPSPPPPPRQLSQLSDSMKQNENGRLSSCSKRLQLDSSDESCVEAAPDGFRESELVSNLLSSINLINHASDEVDSTSNTNTSNNEPVDEQYDGQSCGLARGALMQSRQRGLQPSSLGHLSPLVLSERLSGPPVQQFRQRQPPRPMSSGPQPEFTCICSQQPQPQPQPQPQQSTSDTSSPEGPKRPSELLLSLRLAYDQMPAHVRAAIRSILFIADTIKNEDDENSAIEDWESVSMVVDRLFLWIFFLLCTFGSLIILALAPSLYDQRASIDDKLRIDIPPSNCSASVYAHS